MTFEAAYGNDDLRRVVREVCWSVVRRCRVLSQGMDAEDVIQEAWVSIWRDWEKLGGYAELRGVVARRASWTAVRCVEDAVGRERGGKSRDGSRGGSGRIRGYLEKFQLRDDDYWERRAGLCVSRELSPWVVAYLRELAELIGRPSAVAYLAGGDPPERKPGGGRYVSRVPTRPAWRKHRSGVSFALENPGLVWST